MSTLTRTQHQVICDCCDASGPVATTPADARTIATAYGWQRADIGGRLGDVCPRCTPPEHDRAGCRL